ncbi:hypothetical protein ACH5RR_011647 [Cinchona calisaya]|uniref:Uncharacterized protein n=1 Tax=Cinchona calisaya TaxID=153742 RepID=A0ABD3A809_9GENT
MAETLAEVMKRFSLSSENMAEADLDNRDLEKGIEACHKSLVRKVVGEKKINFMGIRNFANQTEIEAGDSQYGYWLKGSVGKSKSFTQRTTTGQNPQNPQSQDSSNKYNTHLTDNSITKSSSQSQTRKENSLEGSEPLTQKTQSVLKSNHKTIRTENGSEPEAANLIEDLPSLRQEKNIPQYDLKMSLNQINESRPTAVQGNKNIPGLVHNEKMELIIEKHEDQ